MKILITGAGGQLGTEIQRIITTGRSEIGKLNLNYNISDFKATDIPATDISDFDSIYETVFEYAPNIIINCAAYTNVDGCEENVDVAFKSNALGCQNLAKVATLFKSELIHVSTDYVFSGENKNSRAYCEWDETSPQSIYGKSKLLGERWISEIYPQSYIIRTAWLYGYSGNNFVKTILKFAKEKSELKVVNDQIGNPTSANDLAHHILKLPFSGAYGIHHCTNEGMCSWYDFAKEFVELVGFDCKISPCTTSEFPRPAKRPSFSALENMHLANTVGNDMRSWQDAIKSYISHYNKESGEFIV